MDQNRNHTRVAGGQDFFQYKAVGRYRTSWGRDWLANWTIKPNLAYDVNWLVSRALAKKYRGEVLDG